MANVEERRYFLKIAGAAFASLPVAACVSSPATFPEWTGATRGPIIDVHCHLFNGSDLPATRFLKIVFLEMYREEAAPALLDIDDPDVVDGLIQLFLLVLNEANAPTADREARDLLLAQSRSSIAAGRAAAERAVVAAATQYVLDQTNNAPSIDGRELGVVKVSRAIMVSGSPGNQAPRTGPLSRKEAEEAVKKSVGSGFDIGRYLRWFGLFARYRFSLADELVAWHKSSGFSSVLACPALVDYDAWLGERVKRSPLRSQMQVMGKIAARREGPPVHGYMAFDPLRQANFDQGVDRREDALDLVREALTQYGFLGVKLYPPMGFRPSGNEEKPAQRYPEAVDANLKGVVGRHLNTALTKLYKLCIEQGAPIIAHAGASNGAGAGYALRADPAYWLPVFDAHPDLHVCLAHFGGFETRSVAASPTAPLPQASWGWVFGDYVRRHPDRPVFADISFFTEIHGKSDDQLNHYAEQIKGYLQECDPDCRHLMFGSDWIMLGQSAASDGYAGHVHEFFKNRCGFDQKRLDRLFFGNAVRFLGIGKGAPARQRLQRFYSENGLSPSRLAAFDETTD